jgi:hypothetical protein
MPSSAHLMGEERPGEAGARLQPRTASMRLNSCAAPAKPASPSKDHGSRLALPILRAVVLLDQTGEKNRSKGVEVRGE